MNIIMDKRGVWVKQTDHHSKLTLNWQSCYKSYNDKNNIYQNQSWLWFLTWINYIVNCLTSWGFPLGCLIPELQKMLKFVSSIWSDEDTEQCCFPLEDEWISLSVKSVILSVHLDDSSLNPSDYTSLKPQELHQNPAAHAFPWHPLPSEVFTTLGTNTYWLVSNVKERERERG